MMNSMKYGKSNAAGSIMEKEMERDAAKKSEGESTDEKAVAVEIEVKEVDEEEMKEDMEHEEKVPETKEELLAKVKGMKIESLEDLKKIQSIMADHIC